MKIEQLVIKNLKNIKKEKRTRIKARYETLSAHLRFANHKTVIRTKFENTGFLVYVQS